MINHESSVFDYIYVNIINLSYLESQKMLTLDKLWLEFLEFLNY
jgi:hypothetical protein